MDLIEFNTHSFIVKIWLEEPAENHQKGEWRGHITHVPSGERRYLKSLGGIAAFIVPYLVSMGVRLEANLRVRQWLQRIRSNGLKDRANEPGGRSSRSLTHSLGQSSDGPVGEAVDSGERTSEA